MTSTAQASIEAAAPLTVLQGWATMFERRGDALAADKRAEGVEAIARSAKNLRELVDRLLAATREDYRMESGLRLEIADVTPLVASTVAAHAEASDQTWASDIADGLMARVDLTGFEQLLAHLLDNAIKYGGRDATIHVVARDDAGATVIVVADTGPGMPPDLDLFAPFARTESEDRPDSVGIGLHVVKTLVDGHHASIAYTATEPHGTTVTIRLPRP